MTSDTSVNSTFKARDIHETPFSDIKITGAHFKANMWTN